MDTLVKQEVYRNLTSSRRTGATKEANCLACGGRRDLPVIEDKYNLRYRNGLNKSLKVTRVVPMCDDCTNAYLELVRVGQVPIHRTWFDAEYWRYVANAA